MKWVADRSEAFIGDTHGDQRNAVAAACNGTTATSAAGGHARQHERYLNEFALAIPSQATGCMLSGAYDIPAIYASCRGVYTNTVPIDACRGAGRPEATYLLERLMDAAARQLDLPPDEIRQRNFIRPEPIYRTACGPLRFGRFRAQPQGCACGCRLGHFEARRSEANAASCAAGGSPAT